MASLIVSGSSGKEFAIHPAQVVAARCTRIIDLGTHDSEFEGKKKKKHEVAFCFESSELMPETEGDYAGKPFMMIQRYTFSLSDKANLRKALESWRGRPFTPAELDGFNLHNVLGKGCMLNITHSDGAKTKGKIYANVTSIMPLMKGMAAPEAVGEMVFFSLSDFVQAAYDSLSEYFQKVIADSDEYKAMGKPAPAAPAPATSSGKVPPARTPAADFDDDIPF